LYRRDCWRGNPRQRAARRGKTARTVLYGLKHTPRTAIFRVRPRTGAQSQGG
jgi:hypothetical protein